MPDAMSAGRAASGEQASGRDGKHHASSVPLLLLRMMD